jgi:hypothetical protein
MELLLGIKLDEDTTTELELGTAEELLDTVMLDEETTAELELSIATEELLGGALELLLCLELDEDNAATIEELELVAELELGKTAEELLNGSLELLLCLALDKGTLSELELDFPIYLELSGSSGLLNFISEQDTKRNIAVSRKNLKTIYALPYPKPKPHLQ